MLRYFCEWSGNYRYVTILTLYPISVEFIEQNADLRLEPFLKLLQL